MAWNVEVTDTFGGESNYSWVRHYSFDSLPNDTQRSVMRKAKALAGYTGHKGQTDSFGDSYNFRPRGVCHVMFVMWVEPEYRFDTV